jgi:hypothetical protein
MKHDFTDEEIMAYADGELEPVRSAELARLAGKDSQLRSRVDLYKKTADLAKSAMARRPADVSAKLRADIERLVAKDQSEDSSQKVVDLATRRMKPHWFVPSAIAASIALVVGFGAANLQTFTVLPTQLATGPVIDKEVENFLSTSLTGQTLDIGLGKLAMVASFKDTGGHLCREFDLHSGQQKSDIAVACLHSNGWETLIVVAGNSSQDSYSPASSSKTLDAFLQSIGASSALADEEEREALSLIQTN